MYKGRASFFASDLLLLMTLTMCYTAAVSTTNTNEKLVTSKGTFQEAVDTCAGWGEEWNLIGPRSVDEEQVLHKRMVSKMMESQIQTIWITLRHNSLQQWKNVDGTDYDGEIQLAEKRNEMCSLLKLRYEAVKAEICNSQGEGYICQIKDCSHCPYDISPRNCMKVDKTCYVFGCDVGGWYDSQNTCSRQGFSIISLETKSQLQLIVTWLNKRLHTTCTNFWVGLRKESWYYNDTDASHEAGSTFWFKGEPKPESRCAVLQKFDEGYYWKSVSCEEKHSYICAQVHRTTEHTTEDESTSRHRIHATGQTRTSANQRQLSEQFKGTSAVTNPSRSLVRLSVTILSTLLISTAVIILLIGYALTLLHKRKVKENDERKREPLLNECASFYREIIA